MKTVLKLLPVALSLAALVYFGPSVYKHALQESIPRSEVGEEESGPVKGPELERWYFAQWHYPHGTVLPREMMSRIWSEVGRLPSEENRSTPLPNSWVLVGPSGMTTRGGNGRYSGRILDIEIHNGVSTRVAAASGGLWAVALPNPIQYANQITSQAISTFDSDPNNEQIIVAGTGEPGARAGTGLWKTVNRGATWTSVPLNPTPNGFFRLRFRPGSSTVIHATTDIGYLRSNDGGATWTNFLGTGQTTDLAINPTNPDIMYTAVWGTGVYKSTNGGTTWNQLTTGRVPTADVGRVGISLCAGTPNTVYVAIAKNSDFTMLGVYKTVDGGTSWANVSPGQNYMAQQGWYDNTIGVSPTNPNIVLAGGTDMMRTVDGGANWTQLGDPENLHVDHHAITWGNNGTDVWNGNDGGLSRSADAGATWTTTENRFPTTQYVNFDIDPGTNREFAGGSQDNGISMTTNNGATWYEATGGDGSGVAMDVGNPNRWWITVGAYGGNWIFRRLRTVDNGQTFQLIDNGVDPSQQWYHKIRTDRTAPVWLYNNSGPHVYLSTNFGDNWTKLNPTPFPGGGDVFNLSVTRFVAPSAVVYASMMSDNNGERLHVYDGGAWSERSAGLPTGVRLRNVAPHPTDANKAYALMNGFSAGSKVFKTTNRGVTWTNISGDCPDVPLGDLVAHPTNDNLLYLGTEMGCYKTTNGGTNWQRWNSGMPQANIITEMKWIDSLGINGKFYVVAASYGRSIWMREVSGDDPTGVTASGTVPGAFELKQNYPNPFNPTTTIRFRLPVADNAQLKVFDVTGKDVATLVNGALGAGDHSYAFDAGRLASGLYFYRLSTSRFVETRKMMLTK